ncbi:hypothetical protein [Enemella sp. A6]|uniref:hypothetical protein n=1 Tax=Enemella sp. A6 TaxID=3440152 RepID=UPI003EBC183D
MSRVAVGLLTGVLGLIIGVMMTAVVLVVLAMNYGKHDDATVLQRVCSDDNKVCLERTIREPFMGVGLESHRINIYLMQDDGTPIPRYSYWEDPFHSKDHVDIDMSQVETRIVLSDDKMKTTLTLGAERYGNVG